MAETGVLLDARGRPVGQAIAWHDSRGAAEARAVSADLGAPEFEMRTGLPASALCTLSKLRWQRSHLPEAGSAVRWLGVPEWVARSLGAAEVAEQSLASRTGLFELRERRWWADALAWLGVEAGFMAEPVPAGTPVGRVGDALPAARDAVIVIAGHDHVAAMVGAGADRDGDVLHSSGTSDVFVRTIPAQLEPARIADAVSAGVTVGWHVVPDRWVLLSGNELDVALASVLQLLGIDGEAERDALDAAAAALRLRPPLRPGSARLTLSLRAPATARRSCGARRSRPAPTSARPRSPAATRSAGPTAGSSQPEAASAARPREPEGAAPRPDRVVAGAGGHGPRGGAARGRCRVGDARDRRHGIMRACLSRPHDWQSSEASTWTSSLAWRGCPARARPCSPTATGSRWAGRAPTRPYPPPGTASTWR